MDEFKGKLGNYKLIKTEDNTQTVWSEYFDEACHNLSGAKDETIYNYINGCHLTSLIKNTSKLSILDVGFGIGMGLTCLIDFINQNKTNSPLIHYYSIELDDLFAFWSLKNFLPELHLEKKVISDLTYLEGQYQNLHIKILLGDGRLTLPRALELNLLQKFDAIFQDPFSPKKNPRLWSVQWFLFLKNNSNQDVRMATYSSSVSIRKSMIKAGWMIENHKGFGLKKTMTQATLSGVIDSVLLDQLARSPAIELQDDEI